MSIQYLSLYQGANFLEFRREQMIFQINHLWNDYLDERNEFLTRYKKSLTYLNKTYQEMGKNGLNLISKLSRIQYKPRIHIENIKKMGITVSQVDYEILEEEKLPAYTFENTSHYIEDLINFLKELFESIRKYSEIEDLIFSDISVPKISGRLTSRIIKSVFFALHKDNPLSPIPDPLTS